MRLIDADDFFRTFSELDRAPYNNFPTVEPVRHGRWEIYDTYKQTIDGRTFDGWCECSECRTMYPWDFSIYNYCPNCGAKMDEEGKEE